MPARRRHNRFTTFVQGLPRTPSKVTQLPNGKVRCSCGRVVTVNKDGRTRRHNEPDGEPCPVVIWIPREPVHLDELPPVVIPGGKSPKRPPDEPSRLDAGSHCEDCGRWLPGERILCGRCTNHRGQS